MASVTVAEGDTLSKIALMYNMSPSRLQVMNNLFPPIVNPGDILKIESLHEFLDSKHSIAVMLSSINHENANSSFSEKLKDVPGNVIIDNDLIIFKQCQINSATKHQIKIEINLVSIVYTKLTPFNSNLDQFFQNIYEDAPARLTICYLADPLDQTSTNYISFVSSRAELNALEFLMNFFSKQRKAEIKMPIRSSSRLIQEAKENITEIIDLNHEKNKNVNIPNAKRINSLPSHSFTSKFKLYGKSKIFDLVNITMIRKNLCLRMRSHCWKLVYALSKDGCSYQTLFDATKNGAPCILAILTSNNEIIGAFLPDGIKKNVINSGESFVFNFYTSKKGDENNFAWKTKKKSNVYKWSMKNDLIFSASSKDIMIGGSGLNSSISMKCHNGDPSPCGKLGAAIWIDNVMKNGFTEQCPTFDSPPLIDGGYFTIADIEVWDIVPH